MNLKRLLYLGIIALLPSCASDSLEELTGTPITDRCLETMNVSYMNDVQSIVSGTCAFPGCHFSAGPAAGIDLSSYTTLKSYVDNNANTLISAIRHEGNADPMPQGGSKMAEENICLIEVWINEGAQDNWLILWAIFKSKTNLWEK